MPNMVALGKRKTLGERLLPVRPHTMIQRLGAKKARNT
jgi:hypothetical protein